MVLNLIFTLIVFIHGLIHLLGFVKEWKIAEVNQLTGKTLIPLSDSLSKVFGSLWLITFLCFFIATVGFLLKKDWWWMIASLGVIFSQILIIVYWQDAKAGTIANLIILPVIIVSYASWNFDNIVQQEVKTLFRSSVSDNEAVVTTEMLEDLPPPVQRWLTNSGIVGKEQIYTVRLKQKGLMRIKPEQTKWMETTAEQYFTVNNPAFIWQADIQMMPMVSLVGRDKFVDGNGHMLIKLLSLINVVDATDEKINQGTLQRYLAEIIWFPSGALSPYIKWEMIDATSAKATMSYKGVTGSGVFQFNEQGEFIGFITDRYMGGGDEATLEKWVIIVKENRTMNGIKVPVEFEVIWKLEAGNFPWLQLEITEIEYNKAFAY